MNIFGITLTSLDLSLLGVVGLFLAWLIPHRLAISRDRKARFANAAAAFLVAIDTREFPRQNSRTLHDAYLLAIDNHSNAAADFRRFLGLINRIRFDRAWKAYEQHHHQRPADFEGLESHLEKLRGFANPT